MDLKEARHGVPLDNKELVEVVPGTFLGVMIEPPDSTRGAGTGQIHFPAILPGTDVCRR